MFFRMGGGGGGGNVMPGCGGVLPELTVASCQNSVCTFFLVIYAAFSVFVSKSGSPALLERAVGKSCWKERLP